MQGASFRAEASDERRRASSKRCYDQVAVSSQPKERRVPVSGGQRLCPYQQWPRVSHDGFASSKLEDEAVADVPQE